MPVSIYLRTEYVCASCDFHWTDPVEFSRGYPDGWVHIKGVGLSGGRRGPVEVSEVDSLLCPACVAALGWFPKKKQE